ncbi:hypothetical protein GGS23DRAFT_391469 [Durotheca rogersii]|uniref:uncharacterized protein n=1 Tax=Durotheca rogersii TaxID=419775 RepID=UPI00221F2039|nr:uncharacterized protein GGS23DRAFT_391469 [Durotheca rogersii]KAI5856753.1 hypothetical protein GGS23DRAFT_391469 [Durotheca rogersii]
MASPSSSSSYELVEPTEPVFHKFPFLPPEIRQQIWLEAIPSPGINFFNVHSFPNDHRNANCSTSPCWLYLDLRRLAITDDDDAVAEYDPSAWMARSVLRRTCREAHAMSAIPPSHAVTLTLTRPRRGLFVRAGDDQLRLMTPLEPRDGGSSSMSITRAAHTEEYPPVEPLERRRVQVHTNDVLCLSVENCSFNLPYEETPILDDSDEHLGWSFDPQLTPRLPNEIPTGRLCASMARGHKTALNAVCSSLCSILSIYDRGRSANQPLVPLIMVDAYKQELGKRNIEELTTAVDVFWDRFGDRYMQIPWRPAELIVEYRLVKIWPEENDIRERYLASAILHSPKRPAES